MRKLRKYKLKNPFSKATCLYISSCDSSQRLARDLITSGLSHGSLLVTNFQNQGRGRREGRIWISPRGKNLLFSILFDTVLVNKDLLSLKLGLALYKAIEEYFCLSKDVDLKIKWPNDMMLNNKKIAGIICEESGNFVIAGIGLNCNQLVFQDSVEASATSLFLELNKKVNKKNLLELILIQTKDLISKPLEICELEKYLWQHKQEINFLSENHKGQYILQGIDKDGAILLFDKRLQKKHRFFSGSIEI